MHLHLQHPTDQFRHHRLYPLSVSGTHLQILPMCMDFPDPDTPVLLHQKDLCCRQMQSRINLLAGSITILNQY